MSQLLLPSLGAPCDPRRSVLDQLTHRLRSDCGPREWCRPLAAPLQAPLRKAMTGGAGGGKAVESSGSCVPKGCRRDEYPWGYHGVETADLPRMCDDGLTYCPDDESACLPLIALGGACELNRDDSCAPPSDSSYNTTVLCLLQICRLAASPLAAACQLEHTQYLGYDGHSPQPVVEVVTRDDCQAGLFCAETSPSVCVHQRAVGDACATNRECLTFNCDEASKTCDRPATDAGLHLSPLCFVLVGLAILLSLSLTVWLLVRMHASHRAARRDEVRRYFAEQWSFRESITELHAAKTQASKEMRED